MASNTPPLVSDPSSLGGQDIIASGNNVYVVWINSFNVFYKRSLNDRATFDSTIILNRNIGNGVVQPAIAASRNLTIWFYV